LSKFDPITTHHENSIESALEAGIFDKIVVIPSDVTTEIIHTPVLDRQNMINRRYYDDPRVITFLAHSLPTRGTVLGWSKTIVSLLREVGFSPVSIFLWEDYSDLTKKPRLIDLVSGDQYLILFGEDEVDDINFLGQEDEDTGKPILKHLFKKPPKSAEVRDFLSQHRELYEDQKLLNDDTLPLSLPVRKYIYENKIYNSSLIAGNITDAFRNVFGTGLGSLIGRVPYTDEEINKRVTEKLNNNGIVLT